MTEIIDFPSPATTDTSEWGIYSQGMRKSMVAAGFTPQDTDEFLQHFEPIFSLHDFSKYNGEVAVDIPDEYLVEFQKYSGFLTEALGRFTSNLIAERFGLELELFVNGKIALKSLKDNELVDQEITFREQIATMR